MISEHKRAKSKRESIALTPKGLVGKRARMWRQMDYRRISKNREKTIEEETGAYQKELRQPYTDGRTGAANRSVIGTYLLLIQSSLKDSVRRACSRRFPDRGWRTANVGRQLSLGFLRHSTLSYVR